MEKLNLSNLVEDIGESYEHSIWNWALVVHLRWTVHNVFTIVMRNPSEMEHRWELDKMAFERRHWKKALFGMHWYAFHVVETDW